jgi:hypothetical protein
MRFNPFKFVTGFKKKGEININFELFNRKKINKLKDVYFEDF